jgi:hypothetical protein
MSITNFVRERNRTYVRLFYHEEARRRYEAGERVADLAVEYGVTKNAIYFAVKPEWKAKNVANHRRWRTGRCEVCGGPAMRLVSGKKETNPDGRVLCKNCRAKENRTRFVEIDGVLHARCMSICHDFKPLDEFVGGVHFKDIRPNGVHGCCRSCTAELKRRYRANNPDYNKRQSAARAARHRSRRQAA